MFNFYCFSFLFGVKKDLWVNGVWALIGIPKEAVSKEMQLPLQLLSAVATGQHFLKNINNHIVLS